MILLSCNFCLSQGLVDILLCLAWSYEFSSYLSHDIEYFSLSRDSVDLVICGSMAKCPRNPNQGYQPLPIGRSPGDFLGCTTSCSTPVREKDTNCLRKCKKGLFHEKVLIDARVSIIIKYSQWLTDEPPRTFPLVQQHRLSFIAWHAVFCGCVLQIHQIDYNLFEFDLSARQ